MIMMKSQGSYGFLITKELILAPILDLKDHFSASLKLSVEEFQACWIGRVIGTQVAPINCNWVNLVEDKVLTLGVHMSYDVTLAEKLISLI